MKFPDVTTAFTTAVEGADFDGLAALFAEDGVYHDIYYGAFEGRAAIADLLRLFYKGGRDFRWEFFDHTFENGTGYAQYMFSYTATNPRAAGTRVTFDGVGIFKLADGLITHYADVCNGILPMAQMNTPDDLMDKMTARWQGWLEAHPRYAAHQKQE